VATKIPFFFLELVGNSRVVLRGYKSQIYIILCLFIEKKNWRMAVDVYRQNVTGAVAVGDNGFVAVVRETTLEVGQPRATGVLAFIRNTYPASYNHVVRNMNGISIK
jgi:hypothetical protein